MTRDGILRLSKGLRYRRTLLQTEHTMLLQLVFSLEFFLACSADLVLAIVNFPMVARAVMFPRERARASGTFAHKTKLDWSCDMFTELNIHLKYQRDKTNQATV